MIIQVPYPMYMYTNMNMYMYMYVCLIYIYMYTSIHMHAYPQMDILGLQKHGVCTSAILPACVFGASSCEVAYVFQHVDLSNRDSHEREGVRFSFRGPWEEGCTDPLRAPLQGAIIGIQGQANHWKYSSSDLNPHHLGTWRICLFSLNHADKDKAGRRASFLSPCLGSYPALEESASVAVAIISDPE